MRGASWIWLVYATASCGGVNTSGDALGGNAGTDANMSSGGTSSSGGTIGSSAGVRNGSGAHGWGGFGGRAQAGEGGNMPEGGAGGDPAAGGSAGEGGLCNCEQVVGSTALQPLTCFCEDCPTEEEVVSGEYLGLGVPSLACSEEFDITTVRTTGCGFRAWHRSDPYTGAEFFFDESTGDLLGVRRWSDTHNGACPVYAYDYGDVPPTCEDAVRCNACQNPTFDALPPCE